jgi:hypothetical protein
MRLNQSRATTTLGLAACVLAATTGSAAAATTEVRANAGLTAGETLRGWWRFTTPAAWRVTPQSGVFTARFAVDGGPQCEIEVWGSVRGKASRRTASQLARSSIANAIASGRRAGGVYRVGPVEAPDFDTPESWLNGIAVVRVARRRFGQLRLSASFSGADCTAQSSPAGDVTKAMTRILRRARSNLRVVRRR